MTYDSHAAAAMPDAAGPPNDERKTYDEHHHNQGRHADLLQGLGQGTAGGVQSWLATFRRCVRGPDVLSRLARLSMHRTRSARAWPLQPTLGRKRSGYLRR